MEQGELHQATWIFIDMNGFKQLWQMLSNVLAGVELDNFLLSSPCFVFHIVHDIWSLLVVFLSDIKSLFATKTRARKRFFLYRYVCRFSMTWNWTKRKVSSWASDSLSGGWDKEYRQKLNFVGCSVRRIAGSGGLYWTQNDRKNFYFDVQPWSLGLVVHIIDNHRISSCYCGKRSLST